MNSPTAKQTTVCGTCGGQIPVDVPHGLCPRCLLDLGRPQAPALDANDSLPGALNIGKADFDYELLERIGRGGMGVVYRARQKSLNRIVAVKMIGDSVSPGTMARFRREAEMAAKLDHPNIVSIIQVGEFQANPFLVMRLVEGDSLSGRMSEFVLPPVAKAAEAHRAQTEIARLMATVARAVDFAHSRGVLHRDLKPSNILLDLEGRPHLTDFGIAKSLDQDVGLTQTAELLGTLTYMAPEQAGGKTTSRAADIYSLGAILYELLTGQRLFEGGKMEVLNRVIESDPTPPRLINGLIERDLATICLKCLDKNPGRRYATALALAEDLERWMRREPVRAREAGMIVRAQRWTTRNPAVATLIATLSIGIMVCLTLLARANEEKMRKSIALDILRTQSARQLQEIWNSTEIWDSTNAFFEIKSETLLTMAGMEVNALQDVEQRFTIALVADGNPLDRVLRAAAMLQQLENSMGASAGQATRFDLRLYKNPDRAVEDLVGRRVDFAQLNSRIFLRAREQDGDVKALIQILPAAGPGDAAVIFTRKETGIKSIADLRGKSVLLGAADSTLSFWTKASLVQGGVKGDDLAKYRYVDRGFDILPKGSTTSAPRLGNPYSAMTPVEAVMARFYDAAVVKEKRFREVAAEQGLVALHRFSDSGDLLVARGNLPGEVVGAFRRVMLDQNELAAETAFLEMPAKFRAASEEDFKGLLAHLGAETAFAP